MGIQTVYIIVASGAIKNTAAAVGSSSVGAVIRDDRAGGGGGGGGSASKQPDTKQSPPPPPAAATAPPPTPVPDAAAQAVAGLSNRQKKKINQKAFHAGLAAIAADATASAAKSLTATTAASETAAVRAAAAAAMVTTATESMLKANAERAAAEQKARTKNAKQRLRTQNAAAIAADAKTSAAGGSGSGSGGGSDTGSGSGIGSGGAAAPTGSSGSASNFQAARGIVRGSAQWLTVKLFHTVKECVAALRADNRTIWATNLSQKAIPLDLSCKSIPDRLAVVIGREADGVSQEMLDSADRHIYLPMFGFTESYNVSVACALVLQRLLDIAGPATRGRMSDAERCLVRDRWFNRLVDKTPASTVRWTQLAWAKSYVDHKYTLPTNIPYYKSTVGTPLLKPLPVCSNICQILWCVFCCGADCDVRCCCGVWSDDG